ncbi:MAG: thymidylate synthase [bacterium]|nr:thymidylate synthase [Gammaproteobacteria bacterium]HIL97399.1 thymidylate synthase [Pseudomonadales bacterium]
MRSYLDQLRQILDSGARRMDRTGVGTISLFGLHSRYSLADGFPAVTTKKLVWKSMVSELLWFISGSGNIKDLKEIYKHNKLWDLNYNDYIARRGQDPGDGDMGRVYGQQWRHWRTSDGREIDQLADAIELIKHNPDSRRIIVNAWNPGEADANDVALPPCHAFFQFYVADGKLSLHMYQRSADMFLGVPLNIASYALLTHMIARLTGLIAGDFIHTIGDAHIYTDAVEQCEQQLAREPLPLPALRITDRNQQTIDEFIMDDFQLINYQCHEAIKARMAV